jgi:hypothetical protein
MQCFRYTGKSYIWAPVCKQKPLLQVLVALHAFLPSPTSYGITKCVPHFPRPLLLCCCKKKIKREPNCRLSMKSTYFYFNFFHPEQNSDLEFKKDRNNAGSLNLKAVLWIRDTLVRIGGSAGPGL